MYATFCHGPCECQSNVHRFAGFVCTTSSPKEDRTQGRFVVAISGGRGTGTGGRHQARPVLSTACILLRIARVGTDT
jgi:hypothetical protein